MQYGYFDDERKEYVITNPATPESWSNYLGSTEYGAIITNNAGGYSFYKSAAQGRFMRFRTNTIPMDQPGRNIYLRDNKSKDYWSGAWQPVGKSLKSYKSECRHGTAYTVISSEYSNIKTKTTYFVPLGKTYECWIVKIKNKGSENKDLSAFTFVEYASNWHLWMDLINLQYTQYILTMNCVDGIIDHGTNVYLPAQPDNFEEGGQARHTFLGIAGAKVAGFDTDRKKFIGAYRSYQNPLVVEQGLCTNSIASADNGCGSLQINLNLKPGEEKTFVVVMGIGEAGKEGKEARLACEDIKNVEKELDRIKQYWHNRIEGMTTFTPDPEFNSMFNMWNPYNCLMTYAWSRAASLVYAGERDGLGYRDTVQDLLGVLHTIPEEAKERLELMITGQTSTGGAMPVVKPFAHKPGKEKLPDEKEYRSDDCMWLFNTIPAFVKETGDLNFYNKTLPFSDMGEGTVLEHLRKAIEFNLQRSGKNGFPLGLAADWNDCLVLGERGETVFVAFQLRYALSTYIEICELLEKDQEIAWAMPLLNELDKKLKENAWDGEWYLRAFREDGFKFGSHESDEGSIWLNPQTWAVYSGHATGDKAKQVMQKVNERLATDYGVMICDPPYEKTDISIIKATLFNKGMKENGAIFCHTQGWAVIAESMLGHGKQAFNYYKSYLPAGYNTKAEVREIEPYVYCQSTHSKYSARYGASRLPWLSGAATWAYYAASQYILGIQPDYDGLIVDPCIPADWKGFTIQRRFRGKLINIIVKNTGVEKGVTELILNSERMDGNKIPADKLKDENEVKVVMG